MKKDTIISAIVGLILGVIITVLFYIIHIQSKGGKDVVSVALPRINKLSQEYLAKVEDFGILLEDFNNAYEQVQQNIPPEQLAYAKANEAAFKAEILETMINQYVVVATAIEEGFLEDAERARKFRNAAQQALFQLYMAEHLPEDHSIGVAQPQIDQAYAQYGAELRARGMNAQQSKEFLIAQLTQQNRQRWMIDFISKIKEGFRIERNKDLLQQEKISAIAVPVTPISSPNAS